MGEDLDFDLTELAGLPCTSVRSHAVVDDFGQSLAGRVAELEWAPVGVEPCDSGEGAGAHVAADQITGGGGDGAGRSLEGQLTPYERLTGLSFGQFQRPWRPFLTGAVTKGDAPTRKVELSRVVIDGFEMALSRGGD